MALESTLTALAQGFRINLDSTGSAQRRFVASLTAPPGSKNEKGIITVTDTITTTQITPAPIDVNWRTKDVRFVDTDITNAATEGGMPVTDLLTLGAGTVTTDPPPITPGVPGLLGALSGTIPLPIEVTTPTLQTVTVDVRWRIRDQNGVTVGDVTWTLGTGSGTGGDIAPPPGSAMDLLTLTFNLVFAELTSSADPTVRYALEASVRLEAAGVSTGWITLPSVDIVMVAILVPTLAILCRDSDFESQKLVVVPATSPFDRNTIEAAVTTLKETLDPIRGTFDFLGIFIDAAATVADLLRSGTVIFRKADEISNLNNIDLETHWYGDVEAEDELSSMLLIGPPRRRIEGFNKQSFDTGQGQMNLTIDIHLIAMVATLHNPSPTSDPVGRVGVPFPPSGTRWSTWDPWRDITGFGDEFSSLRFAWET